MKQQSSLSAEELRTLSEDELQSATGGGLELSYKPFPRGLWGDPLVNVIKVNPILVRGIVNPEVLVGFTR